jgi:hypothetical protein
MLGKRAAAAGVTRWQTWKRFGEGWRDFERRLRSSAHLRMRNSRSQLPIGSLIRGHVPRCWARRTVVRPPRASSGLYADQGMTTEFP